MELARKTSVASKDIKRLFLAHQGELQAYLVKLLRSSDRAADLTQETFLRFAEYCGANPSAVITHERSYLYRTAHNLAVDLMRRESREKTNALPDDELVDLADEAPSPERAVGGRSDLDLVRAAILELPERTRRIFVLARIEELTYHEVAECLRISESSVQKHLAKATKHVMQRLRKT